MNKVVGLGLALVVSVIFSGCGENIAPSKIDIDGRFVNLNTPKDRMEACLILSEHESQYDERADESATAKSQLILKNSGTCKKDIELFLTDCRNSVKSTDPDESIKMINKCVDERFKSKIALVLSQKKDREFLYRYHKELAKPDSSRNSGMNSQAEKDAENIRRGCGSVADSRDEFVKCLILLIRPLFTRLFRLFQ